jgi:hypothetical protein
MILLYLNSIQKSYQYYEKYILVLGKVGKCGLILANIISCNYEDILTGRVYVFDLTNLC